MSKNDLFLMIFNYRAILLHQYYIGIKKHGLKHGFLGFALPSVTYSNSIQYVGGDIWGKNSTTFISIFYCCFCKNSLFFFRLQEICPEISMKVENLTIKLRVGYNLPIAIVLQGVGADIQPLTYLESELE